MAGTYHTRLISLIVVATLALAAMATWPNPASAQSGGGYTLTWSTVDGGGGTSTGGGYTLSGTAGQPDAGAQAGGSYTQQGGFWGEIEALLRLFVPLFRR